MPRELEDRAGAGAVNLELVDKRGESYEAPAYTAFRRTFLLAKP